MNRYLFAILFITQAVAAFGQQDIAAKEAATARCLNDKVRPADWEYITRYFESYLVDNGLGKVDQIEKAYLEFIEWRRTARPLPPLPNRASLKQRLVKAKIIDGTKTYGFPFVECFYEPYHDYETYPDSVFKDIVSVAYVMTQVDVSMQLIMGGLKVCMTERALEKDIYKRVVILLGFVDMVYLEEYVEGQAKDDNPIFRMFKEERVGKTGSADDVVPPAPDAGYKLYNMWIYNNNKMLRKKEELGNSYRTIVRGEVDERGNLINIGVWRGIGRGFDEEAYRLIKGHAARKWRPGLVNGKPQKMDVDIEVDFRIK